MKITTTYKWEDEDIKGGVYFKTKDNKNIFMIIKDFNNYFNIIDISNGTLLFTKFLSTEKMLDYINVWNAEPLRNEMMEIND